MSVAYKKNGTEIPITSAIMGGGESDYTVDTSIHQGVVLYRFGKMRVLSFSGGSFSLIRDQNNTLFTLANDDKPKVGVGACCGTNTANRNTSITISTSGAVLLNGWTLSATATCDLYCTLVYFVE